MKYFLIAFAFLTIFSTQAFAKCNWDSDCQKGYHCDSKTNQCKMGKWPDGGCNWDSDCLAGYHCDSKTNECRMGKWPDGGCNWDSDCLDGYECENNECVQSVISPELQKILNIR